MGSSQEQPMMESMFPFLRIFWIRTDRNLTSGDLVVEYPLLEIIGKQV